MPRRPRRAAPTPPHLGRLGAAAQREDVLAVGQKVDRGQRRRHAAAGLDLCDVVGTKSPGLPHVGTSGREQHTPPRRTHGQYRGTRPEGSCWSAGRARCCRPRTCLMAGHQPDRPASASATEHAIAPSPRGRRIRTVRVVVVTEHAQAVHRQIAVAAARFAALLDRIWCGRQVKQPCVGRRECGSAP